MTNQEKYLNAFTETFEISEKAAREATYKETDEWDSVGHMRLINALEDAFDIMMDTDDIVDLSSFEKGMEILSSHYDIEF